MNRLVITLVIFFGGNAALAVSSFGAEEKFTTGASDPLIRFVDEHIQKVWTENEIKPSGIADDAEWVRRVHLDIVGHVPSGKVVEAFLRDKDQAKRSKLIETLLADPGYVRNFTTYWTNTLIGRVTPEKTNRGALEKFLRESFAKNRPWNEIAYDLLSAEGRYDENGATNYLLAQLQLNPNSEEYVVEATAKTARVFLGLQVQCTQCHNHPFNDWKQNQFWEFNSFFRQMRREDHEKYNASTGQMDDDYSELVHRDFDGPVYFETRAGLMLVAYPKYFGTEVDPGNETNRRLELAKSITKDDTNKWLAKAIVNRMWGHYFANGFTRPIDDMGPHNPASHPELLDRLTDEFVKSGYDLKQLTRWICNSEAYNLTSKFNPKNEIDNPANGEVPLFSHMYVKPLQVEQLYESLLVATAADTARAESSPAGSDARSQKQREDWTQQFLRIFGNDEEDSAMYSGTIPQALLMMNGQLVKAAISGDKGSYLASVLANPAYKKEPDRIRALYLAALGRTPSSSELKHMQGMMSKSPDKLMAYQDLYWALLNSNEFIVNH